MRWLAKDKIDIIDLLNASDASVLQNTFTKAQWGNVSLLNKRVVLNNLFSEYGFTQNQSKKKYC